MNRLLMPAIKQSLAFVFAVALPSLLHGENIRVATYNIHYDNFNSDQMIDAIRTADTDIVCLQEACERTIEIIRSELPDDYPYISIDGQFGFAAKQAPTNVTLDSASRFRVATFEWNRKPIRVVNTHLTPVALPDQPNFVQVMAGLSNSDQAHQSEISRILELADLKSPTIILGDFNALSGAKAIGKLRSAGLIDSIASKHADPDRHTTWDWQTMRKLETKKFRSDNLGVINSGGGLDIRLRIDYVFHTNHFKTVESKVIRRQGSDHFLIVSELDLSDH